MRKRRELGASETGIARVLKDFFSSSWSFGFFFLSIDKFSHIFAKTVGK